LHHLPENGAKILKIKYSKNPHIRTYNIQMCLFILLCDEITPVIKVLVPNTGSKEIPDKVMGGELA